MAWHGFNCDFRAVPQTALAGLLAGLSAASAGCGAHRGSNASWPSSAMEPDRTMDRHGGAAVDAPAGRARVAPAGLEARRSCAAAQLALLVDVRDCNAGGRACVVEWLGLFRSENVIGNRSRKEQTSNQGRHSC